VEQEHWSNPEVDRRNDLTRFRVTAIRRQRSVTGQDR